MISIMMTWGHMIWVFLPLPLMSLLLLTILPQSFGTRLVQKIFFTRISIGHWHTRLVWVFIGASLIIFSIAARTIHLGFASAHVPCSGSSCPYHGGETMWYRRASRYRAERNFWLSLFTLVLWLLVYKIYSLNDQIMKLRQGSGDGKKTNKSNSDKDD
mmetsp:Transcript_8470/g.12735  ORF Transcript_8470/g.12735 Transcript_8470/m.12735 type:complete len:158 (-) Transcript_8470:2241-2714(-)